MPVYSKLEDVSAPADLPGGGSFNVEWACTKNGRAAVTTKQLWKASGPWPVIQQRVVATVAGSRKSVRPYKQHSAPGTVLRAGRHIELFPTNLADHSETAEWMPLECHADDVGWVPGPVGGPCGRAQPAFTGGPIGPTDTSLDAQSDSRRIMESAQFSARYKARVVVLARQHCAAWQGAHSNKDGVERAFCAADLCPEHFELWIAVRIKIAMLNSAVPAKWLWDRKRPGIYDPRIDAACPYDVYRWFCRHFSFGEYGDCNGDATQDDGAAPLRGTPGFDRFVKRRELSDIARVRAASAFNPGQDCGVDDGIRPTRHLDDGVRMRHKAAVHAGRAFHSLNCAETCYFMYWEEQGWHNASTVIPVAMAAPIAGE